jgi:cob(I)alamin adenosyltransferase
MSSQETYKKSSLYTKTGDKGTTSLYNGDRVLKNSVYCNAVGDVDELSSVLGVLYDDILSLLWRAGLKKLLPDDDKHFLTKNQQMQDILHCIEYVQSRLLDLGSHIATPRESSNNERKLARTDFNEEYVKELEKFTDRFDASVPRLTNFILPRGNAHLARTVCRRAERSMIPLFETGEISEQAYIFINRLSDMLFAMGRHITINILNESEKIYRKS